jgi:hypothetical protein
MARWDLPDYCIIVIGLQVNRCLRISLLADLDRLANGHDRPADTDFDAPSDVK